MSRSSGDGGARPFDRVESSDVVVVGTGAAGLSAVAALAGRKVTVLSKGEIGRDGSSRYAQGGIAAALGAADAPRLHAADTLRVSAGLGHPKHADVLAEEGPERVRELVAAGARFDRSANGELAFGLEAGHGIARIVHARDATGAELMRTLVARLERDNDLEHAPHTFAYDLAVERGRVTGVEALSPQGERILYRAPAVILATGGVGQLFRHTTNPAAATGDGIAMAARAGALLADLEFIQFHPTALDVPTTPLPLLTEALRGAGARLVDDRGQRFMTTVDERAELAPRDVVARAIWRRRAAGERVSLDARKIFAERPEAFPTVARLCAEHGLDPAKSLLPVVPAAHYSMGGVWVDACGRTSLPGLWACGETACTGVHGANRLASNSLLEALVFGRRTGLDIGGALSDSAAFGPARVASSSRDLEIDPRPVAARPVLEEIRRHAQAGLGIERDRRGLSTALDGFQRLLAGTAERRSPATSLALVGYLAATAALAREESRGAHARSDFPATSAQWARHSFLRLDRRQGALTVELDRPPQTLEHGSAASGGRR